MIILALYYILYLGHKQRLVVKQNMTTIQCLLSYREISLYYLGILHRKRLRVYYCRQDIAHLKPNDSHYAYIYVHACERERCANMRYNTRSRCRCRENKKNNCCQRRARYFHLLFEIA